LSFCFISHASPDKERIAQSGLIEALQDAGV
jgi:hypothetical protein